jgi:hypothetical protein
MKMILMLKVQKLLVAVKKVMRIKIIEIDNSTKKNLLIFLVTLSARHLR